MIRRCAVVTLTLLLGALAPGGWADQEYWVSVGSYRSYAEAESARAAAGTRLPESFSIVEAQLDSGLWYRVLAGPYLTPEIADHMLDEARRQGFESPWILVSQTTLVGSVGEGSGYLLESGPDADDEIDFEQSRLDVPDEAPLDVPGFNAPIRPDEDIEHKLVSEAPEDFRLHRLHRD